MGPLGGKERSAWWDINQAAVAGEGGGAAGAGFLNARLWWRCWRSEASAARRGLLEEEVEGGGIMNRSISILSLVVLFTPRCLPSSSPQGETVALHSNFWSKQWYANADANTHVPGRKKKTKNTQSTLLLTTCDGAMAHVLLSIFIAEREDGRAQHGNAKGLVHLRVWRRPSRRIKGYKTGEFTHGKHPSVAFSDARAKQSGTTPLRSYLIDVFHHVSWPVRARIIVSRWLHLYSREKKKGRDLILSLLPLSPFPTFLSLRRLSLLLCLPTS